MGPTDQEFSGEHEVPAATDAERERMEMAFRAGWSIRYDPLRLEFTAARELRKSRTLAELLDAVEAADHGE
jgi:hypothetical protein